MISGKKFSNKKSRWRNKVVRCLHKIDDIGERFNKGHRIGMGTLYEAARRIAAVGEEGHVLREKMDRYDVRRIDMVHESIAAKCKLLESAAKILELIMDRQGLRFVEFPVFTSDLSVVSDVETSALEAFTKLVKEVEGE